MKKQKNKFNNNNDNDSSTVRTRDLIREIEELTHSIKRQNSYTRGFWAGVIKGVGYAIGATILFGILLAIIGYIARNSEVGWITDLIQWANLEDQVNLN